MSWAEVKKINENFGATKIAEHHGKYDITINGFNGFLFVCTRVGTNKVFKDDIENERNLIYLGDGNYNCNAIIPTDEASTYRIVSDYVANYAILFAFGGGI